jgi:hypothetical protein
MCYNFLLLFPSGFKEFLVAYTLVFSLVFILQEFLEEQYHPLISRMVSIKGSVTNISTDDLNRFLGFPFGHISMNPTSPYARKSFP